MIIFKGILAAVCAYMLGSLSMSICISKCVMNSDVRAHGSGNAGATNMARVFGLRLGVLTLAGDMLKAALAMLAGWLLLGEWGLCISGAACLVGHCFPVLHEFRGGKGVSAGAAVLLAVDWRVLLAAVVCFAVFVLLSRKVSLGSLGAAVMGFCAAAYLGVSTPRLILAAFAMLIVMLRHRENILRLIAGTEPDFKPAGEKKKKPETTE